MDKIEVLKKLQEIQLNNIGVVDCHIETRKDMKTTQIIFSFCNYGVLADNSVDPKNKSKLYIHRFKWSEPDCEKELNLIDSEIKKLYSKY